MRNLTMFGLDDTAADSGPRIQTLPVSVIETAKQATSQRAHGGHDATSSREDPSPFPLEVASLCAQLFLRDAALAVDPFAGWGERAAVMRSEGRAYYGVDLSLAACRFAREQFSAEHINADSRLHAFPEHDGLLTCPPYWSLERYEGGGLSDARTWSDFVSDYRAVLANCARTARMGATYCLMVGSWRSDGIHYDLPHVTKSILYSLGFNFVDSVVVSRLARSKVKVMIPQAVRLGYTVRVHEELLVFRRGPVDANSAAVSP